MKFSTPNRSGGMSTRPATIDAKARTNGSIRATGSSVLTAVDCLREAGAEVVGVAVLVDRGARQQILNRGLPYVAVYEQAELGL